MKEVNGKEFAEKAISQMMDLWVTPEIERRKTAGQVADAFELRAAQIIFFPTGGLDIRLNDEVAIKRLRLVPGLEKHPGDFIYENEIIGIEQIALSPDERDCGHVTLLKVGGAWTMLFDFRYNKSLSTTHIAAAEEFFGAAERAFEHNHWRAFVDNMFSAIELLAKAILLPMPDHKFRTKTSHKTIKQRFNKFAQLGNIDNASKDALNKLDELRSGARYLNRDFSISEREAEGYLAIAKNMISAARHRIS